jgi:hypothetical protein
MTVVQIEKFESYYRTSLVSSQEVSPEKKGATFRIDQRFYIESLEVPTVQIGGKVDVIIDLQPFSIRGGYY